MSSYLSCVAYEDIRCRILIDGHIYLFIDSLGSDFGITFNPNQAKQLGNALIKATSIVTVGKLKDKASSLFGDIETQYEIIDKTEDNANEINTRKRTGKDTVIDTCDISKNKETKVRIA